MSVCPVCLGADTTTTICANCAFVLQRLGVALPDPDPSKPVKRKLNDETRASIIEAIRVVGGPALKNEEPYVHQLAYYVFSLLENQWPSFWEK